MDERQAEEALIYCDSVNAFLASIHRSDESGRNSGLAASVTLARDRFETLQAELAFIWEQYLQSKGA
jgi:hypothetical protein